MTTKLAKFGLARITCELLGEILVVLQRIDAGELSLDLVPDDGVLGSLREYHCSNGWKIFVFDDAGQWDYIHQYLLPDGRIVAYDDIASSSLHVADFTPTNQEAWKLTVDFQFPE